MDLLLKLVLLLWSSGLQADDKHTLTGAHCETTDTADIMLVIEDSENINPDDFKTIQSFLSKIVSAFTIGPDRVQIGLVRHGPKTEWHLNAHQTKQSLLDAISSLALNEGEDEQQGHKSALMYILFKNFRPHVGMRAHSQRIAILITDRDCKNDVLDNFQHLKDTGIDLYVIEINIADWSDLGSTAFNPRGGHMFSVSDFPLLLHIVDNLTMTLCDSIKSSDSVRLVNGTNLCSGRLEVRLNQSSQRWWSSVCEEVFDQQDAEVVCRELSCGIPTVLQGAPYQKLEAPMWNKEFNCRGNESALRDCSSSGSARNICSPGKAVGLTCSEPVRLVGGDNNCTGTLEIKRGQWRPVDGKSWTVKNAATACKYLDCGSVVSTERRDDFVTKSAWLLNSKCVHYGSALHECVSSDNSSYKIQITCSDSIRLVNGTSLCSGRLEVKLHQSNRWRWSSVCEEDFDQLDAEVVCRELGCGIPTVLQDMLYREKEAPMWNKEFKCRGDESALMDCRRSGSVKNICSTGKAAGLTCSVPVRLVGGDNRCAGRLEIKRGEWRPVDRRYLTMKNAAAFVCGELGCGSAVSIVEREEPRERSVWRIKYDCIDSGSALTDCVSSYSSNFVLEINCSDSVRLVKGTNLCSGRLEVKLNRSSQWWWSSVCEEDFNQLDAEVVCRELGCGVPTVLQGAPHEDLNAPMWSKDFECRGNESSLTDCWRSGSARKICSPGKAVGLTCSEQEDVRLIGGTSHCAGALQVKRGQWRSVDGSLWTLDSAAMVCRHLDCGSAVSIVERKESSMRPVWRIAAPCAESGSALRDCVSLDSSLSIIEITCSGSGGPGVSIIRLVLVPMSLLGLIFVTFFIWQATRVQKPCQQEDFKLQSHAPVLRDEEEQAEE